MNSPAITADELETSYYGDLALKSSTSARSNKSSSTFTRTKLCSFHLRGMCAHGSNCSYAHEIVELRDQPDLSKTRMCPLFRKGNCLRTDCTYAHSRDELRGTDDVYKTSLCRFWANGRCAAGKYCRHAHGIEEMRVRPVRDESITAGVSEPSLDETPSDMATDFPSTPTVIPIELLEELINSTTEIMKNQF